MKKKNTSNHHLQLRNDVYYFVKRLSTGKLIVKSLKTSDLNEAKKLRSEELKKLVLGGEEKAPLPKAKKALRLPTVLELVESYEKWVDFVNAVRKGPNARSAKANVNYLIRIICARFGFQPDSSGKAYGVPAEIADRPISIIDGDLPSDYEQYFWKLAARRGKKDTSTEISIASAIRQSRAIFADKSKASITPLEWYEKEGLALPDSIQDFRKAAGKFSHRGAPYQKPPQALITKTLEAAEVLKRENPALGAAFVLAYDLGLRAKEAAWAKWDWFEPRDDGSFSVKITKVTQIIGQEKGFQGPKSSNIERPGRTIAVPAETARWLYENIRVLQQAEPEQTFDQPTKLNFKKAQNIRGRVEAGETKVSLAKEYGVSEALIRQIVLGKKWKAPLAQVELPEDAGEYVLPGLSFTKRYRLIQDELNAWLRDLGWTKEPGKGHNGFEKASHELRKLKGSEYYVRLGAVQARNFLGHASVVTTENYYAALGDGEVQVLYPEALTTPKAAAIDSFFQGAA